MPPPNGLPPFVEYGGTQSWPAPISFTNVDLWAFWFQGDYAKIQALCDKFFEAPSGGELRFVPLTGQVMMSFADLKVGRFNVAPNRGFSSERELTFWIFGLRQRRIKGIYVTEGLAAFSPYLFLDNSIALITGREVFGYNKQAGWITLPSDNDPSADFAVDVYGCETFAHDTKWDRIRYLTIGAAQFSLAQKIDSTWYSAEEAIRGMVDIFRDDADYPRDLGVELAAFPNLLAGDLPQIFLKQFRDIEQGETCCYQATTEAVMRVTSLHSVGLSMGHPVTFADLESTPVIPELGLQGTDHTGLGFKMEVDMELQPGQVLWQFQGP